MKRVFHTDLDNLPEGVNALTYDGRDGQGESLFNGVYLAVIEMKGDFGHVKEKFKVLVVK
jgi:hypothetical protein